MIDDQSIAITDESAIFTSDQSSSIIRNQSSSIHDISHIIRNQPITINDPPSSSNDQPIAGGSDIDNADCLPSLLDHQRAVVASACTYHNAPVCRSSSEDLLKQLHFVKVLFAKRADMRPFSSTVHNLVLAVAVDASRHKQSTYDRTLFVAFPGTQSFDDLLIDLDIKRSRLTNGKRLLGGGIPGNYHDGLQQRLNDIFPSMRVLDDYIRENGIRRLIFCGHNLGGALAHLALIKFTLFAGHVGELEGVPPISIAFGSPHFCDGEARDFFAATGLEKQMFTYINAGDPVPRLLEDLEKTRKAVLKRVLHLPTTCCGRLRECLGVTSLAARAEVTGRTQFWSSGFPLCACVHAFYTACTISPSGTLLYAWAGITYPDEYRPNHECQTQLPLVLVEEAIEYHNIRLYVAGLLRNANSMKSLPPGKHYPIHSVLRAEDAVHPAEFHVGWGDPKISSCVLRFRGRHWPIREAKIIVEGVDLSMCKRWVVSIQDLRRWKSAHGDKLSWSLQKCTHEKLVLNLEKKTVDNALVSFLTRWSTVLRVSVETPLGVSRECRVHAQNPWLDSCIECIMSCGLAKLLLMQSCGQPLAQWCIDTIDAHVAEGDVFHAASVQQRSFTSFVKSAANQEFDSRYTSAWKKFADPAIEILRNDVKLPENAARAMTRILTTPAIDQLVGLSSRGSLLPFRCRNTVLSYRKCLELLCQQLMHTAEARGLGLRDLNGASTHTRTSFFENIIHERWEQLVGQNSEEKFTSRKEANYSAIERAQRALQKKGRTIYNLFRAHEILGEVRTVVFVGPMFAGKSSLIKCLLDQADVCWQEELDQVFSDGSAGAESSSPSARRDTVPQEHGTVSLVERWRLDLQVFGMQMQPAVEDSGESRVPVLLVEMPAIWEAERRWEKLVHVPDLVVVVVSFAGENALHAEQWAEEVRLHSCCQNIVVIVNGMDRVLHGSPKRSVWKKYDSEFLTKLQHELARSSNVPVNRVLMSVAIPDEELEVTSLQKLMKLSLLIHLQGDITRALKQLILELPHHQHRSCG